MLKDMSREPYEPRGILHSEMALIIEHCRHLGIERFIESGVARGQSAYMLAKYMPDVEVHSVELRNTPDLDFACVRLGQFRNVRVYLGDGANLLPLLAASSTKPTAVMCDGPKGAKAVQVVRECFSLPQVKVGFIHDMRRLDHGEPSPHRKCAVEHFPYQMFSDDQKWISETSWMDAENAMTQGQCGAEFEAVHGSYGPTIGVFLNPISKQQTARE